VRRHNVRGSQPSPDMVMQTGDVLVLFGLPEALQLAELRLHKG
jgi:CPA2 family monovalent cation:H+ antiporter-2